MKVKILLLFVMAGSMLGLAGCHKALDLSPKDRVTDFEMWNDQNMVVLYTNNFYAQIRSGFNNTAFATDFLLSSITDDAAVPNTNSRARTMFANPSFDAANSPLNTTWTSRYRYIRNANIYLAQIDQVPGDKELNKRLKAEVRFLRAYYYYDLVSFFGQVPVITTAQELTDSLFYPRNSLTECYDFLGTELDLAANDLPTVYPANEIGRITRQAAWALKCRVQMMKQDWAGAAATAKAIMDLKVNSLLPNYANVFTTANNAEMILSVQHNSKLEELGSKFDYYTLSPYYGGLANNCPTQNLVDDYEMQATGLPVSAAGSGYDATKPYAGRDPRFYATILYDDAVFKSRKMEMFTGGADVTPGGFITTSNITPTGYFLKKFTNEGTNVLDPNARSGYNWPLIRYAEILLNYAEAQNEAIGPDATVYDAVNLVRQRAGMPKVAADLSQGQMRSVIRHERRIELAFEDFRYWDVKRWKLAENLFSNTTNPIRKVTITRNPTTGVKTYSYSNITNYNRLFQVKHYLFPIPKDEMLKPGNKLSQNEGWN